MPEHFPILHKPTKVLDESLSGIPVDVTAQDSYAQFVALITHFRIALYQDKVLREPYLRVLKRFYESDEGAQRQLETLRPHPATDDDVLRFIQDYWPDTHLVSLAYKDVSDDEDPDWEARIPIVAPIVDLWLSKPSKPKLSSTELAALILAIIMRESAHRLVVWWGLRDREIPPTGAYVEMALFGGIVVGEFLSHEVGRFDQLCSVGILDVHFGVENFYRIDQASAAKILKLDTQCGLPLFNIINMDPTPDGVNCTRARIMPYATGLKAVQTPALVRRMLGNTGIDFWD